MPAETRDVVKTVLNSGVMAFDLPTFRSAYYPEGEGYLKWDYERMPRPFRIHDDGRVELTVIAPNAQKVSVVFVPGVDNSRKAYDFEKGEEDYWNLTLDSMAPGLHHLFYSFDGVERVYEMAPVAYGYMRLCNFIDIPAPDGAFYEYRDIPHGSVRFEMYPSGVTGRMRRCAIYTPPGYEDSKESYPVVFIQHAGEDTETGAVWQGKFNYILDTLIAEGKAVPMIAVFNCGYAFEDWKEYYHSMEPGSIGTLIVQDCIPFLESKYRVARGAENHAFIGYGMGGFEAMGIIGSELADHFAYLSSNAGPPVSPRDWKSPLSTCFEDPDEFNRKHKLLIFGMETLQPDFVRADYDKGIQDLLDHGIMLESFYSEGWHCYQTWRHMMKHILPKLFR